MATPKKTRAKAAPAPVQEAPLEPMDPLTFLNQNLQDSNYTETTVQLEGLDGMFSLNIRGKNLNSAWITLAMKFTRPEAPVAVFRAVEAMSNASLYADHQEITTPDFQP